MINRRNYKDVQEFLVFQRDIKQCNDQTIASSWSRLRHLLEWADEKRLIDAYKIKPTYPTYLGGLKKADGSQLIGSAHFSGCCKTARAFFTWARDEYHSHYKRIDQNWVLSLRPPRERGEQAELKKREIYTVEEVIKLVSVEVDSLMLHRVQAASAFLFLSGMRIGAFVSLPASCVDLESQQVSQLPKKGVNTKNHKAAITTLLNIPELLVVVTKWDKFLKENCFPECLWFAHFTHLGELAKVNPTAERIKIRRNSFHNDLQELCSLAGVDYKSPHKFRHGHAVYALKRANNMMQMKAISQNLMHSTVGITDGIYGNLVHDDVHDVIASLSGVETKSQADQEAVARVVELVMAQMKASAS